MFEASQVKRFRGVRAGGQIKVGIAGVERFSVHGAVPALPAWFFGAEIRAAVRAVVIMEFVRRERRSGEPEQPVRLCREGAVAEAEVIPVAEAAEAVPEVEALADNTCNSCKKLADNTNINAILFRGWRL